MNSGNFSSNVSLASLRRYKRESEKIACLTAYDFAFACILDRADVDVVLVGDSLGMVAQGGKTTVKVSMDDMIYHCTCVSRGVERALIMADMPFMTYATVDDGLRNAGRLVREGGAQVVKLESGERQVRIVRELSSCGIASCAHLGLRPQWIHKMGDYAMQAKNSGDAGRLMEDAVALADAGADMLLLECVPSELAHRITETVSIPVIGIGAGPKCDGQVLVTQDILGMTGYLPRFAKNFLIGCDSVEAAVAAYVRAVKSGEFP